jgi:hypothetical protein
MNILFCLIDDDSYAPLNLRGTFLLLEWLTSDTNHIEGRWPSFLGVRQVTEVYGHNHRSVVPRLKITKNGALDAQIYVPFLLTKPYLINKILVGFYARWCKLL